MVAKRVCSIIVGLVLTLGIFTGCSVNDMEKDNKFKEVLNNTIKSENVKPKVSDIKLNKATVVRHIDGDTFEAKLVNSGKVEKVRMILVNTPETVKANSSVEPYGKEASEYTKKSLLNRTIYLEKDVSDTDKYGRSLYYVWLEKPKNLSDKEITSKMFNAILLKEGYAQIMTIPPNVKYADLFVKLQREAREDKKGLWSLSEYKNVK